MPNVSGFANPALLMQHFTKHNPWDFHYQDAAEYLDKAKAFLETNLTAIGAEECVDPQSGDTIRFSIKTNEFAVVNPLGILRTYYRPMPRHLAPPGWPAQKMHSQPANYDYFRGNC